MRTKPLLVCLFLATAFRCPGAGRTDPTREERRDRVVRTVEKIAPSVVNISTEKIVVRRYADPFLGFRDDLFDRHFRDFFAPFERRYRTQSLGSGVLIHPDGYILTNEHVVRRASGIRVTLADGRGFDARLIGSDARWDLALLKIDGDEGESFPSVSLAPTYDVYLAEIVIALGNPFGLENTISVGRVSHRGRQLREGDRVLFERVIQIDAAINPGNSGGPLVDIAGDLIGINTAILAGSEGIGFALPLEEIEPVLLRLMAPERIGGFWEGIRFGDDPLDPVIAEVEEDSPAAEAGLQAGDRILRTAGRAVKRSLDHRFALLDRSVNDTVPIEVERDGRKIDLTLVPAALQPDRADRIIRRRLGISVQTLTPDLAGALGTATVQGVVVSDVDRDGPCADLGIEAGMVILEAGGRSVDTVEGFADILSETESGSEVPLTVLVSQRARGAIVSRIVRIEVPTR